MREKQTVTKIEWKKEKFEFVGSTEWGNERNKKGMKETKSEWKKGKEKQHKARVLESGLDEWKSVL